MQYSRLSRRYDRLTRERAYLLLGASALLLILFAVFGFPAILNLAATIRNFGRNGQTKVDKGIAPNTPTLSQDFDATNSANIKITGVADPKITIELFQNDRSVDTTNSGSDGKFSFDVSLSKGDNLFTSQAISDTGVKSGKSKVYKVTLVAFAPKLEISNPHDGDKSKENQITVSGKTDPGATLTVNDRLAITSSDGSYSFVLNLSSGDNKIRVVATDKAGNQTTKEIIVRLE